MPPEKKHGLNPKGVAGSKFVNGEERGQNPKEWPVLTKCWRLKVVKFGEEGSKRRSSLLVASLLVVGSKGEEREVK